MVSGHSVGSTETQGEGEARWEQWLGRDMLWGYRWSGEKFELRQFDNISFNLDQKKKIRAKGSHLDPPQYHYHGYALHLTIDWMHR